MKGYKGFENDMTCRGFQYEVGKEYEMDGEPEMCKSGFHFCKTMANVFNYYRGADKRYAEVEAYGDVVEGDDKCVTNKIRILREIPYQEADNMTNTGNCNTGNCNTGHRNTGNCNTGNCNTGDWNTGHWNTGHWNTGNWNTGNCNTGNCNTGHRNTGDWNTGNRNTGDWNTTKYSAGCFNTEQQKAIMFNKPSDWTLEDWWYSDARYILSDAPQKTDVAKWIYASNMTDAEKEAHPEYKTTDGYLKVTHEAPNRQEWWDKLPEADKKTVMAIPNFDAEVFKQCTGIEVRNDETTI